MNGPASQIESDPLRRPWALVCNDKRETNTTERPFQQK